MRVHCTRELCREAEVGYMRVFQPYSGMQVCRGHLPPMLGPLTSRSGLDPSKSCRESVWMPYLAASTLLKT